MIVTTSSESGSQLRTLAAAGKLGAIVAQFLISFRTMIQSFVTIGSSSESYPSWNKSAFGLEFSSFGVGFKNCQIFVGSGSPVRNGSIRAEIRLGAIGDRLSNLRDQLQIFHVKLHPQSRPLVRV